MCRGGIIFLFWLLSSNSWAQSGLNKFLQPSDSLNLDRRNAIYISEGVLGGVTLIGLDQLWYADYARSRFHIYNDNDQWLQMDKAGHLFTSYQMGRAGANALKWSGASRQEQLIYGSTLGLAFLSAVEFMDGYSSEWGFSWGDMLANASGTVFYVGQDLLWQEQRITIKYSFHPTRYASANPRVLGNNFMEQMLKDYNGQTYWLSANLKSFFPDTALPVWLNVAIGYGADGMVFGNKVAEIEKSKSHDPQRQFYFSLDLDLARINTRSALLRSILEVLNVIKIPFPTLELVDKKRLKLHGIYF